MPRRSLDKPSDKRDSGSECYRLKDGQIKPLMAGEVDLGIQTLDNTDKSRWNPVFRVFTHGTQVTFLNRLKSA